MSHFVLAVWALCFQLQFVISGGAVVIKDTVTHKFPDDVSIVEDGNEIILECPSIHNKGHITWEDPNENKVVEDGKIPFHFRGRFILQNDNSLLIKYAGFPTDNGTWFCSTPNNVPSYVDVLVMVSPWPKVPSLSPSSGEVKYVRSEQFVFTCTAQYAYPPVTLIWNKLSGPGAEYNVLPQINQYKKDGKGTASSSLILTPFNDKSVYQCVASHPTFQNKSYKADLSFQITEAQHLPQVMKMKAMQNQSYEVTKSWVDKVFSIIIGVIFLLMTMILIILHFTKKFWKIRSSKNVKNGNRHVKKIFAGIVLLFGIQVILTLLIPIYLSGFPPPIPEMPNLMLALPGAEIWLDCLSISDVSDDLLVITWRKGHEKIYSQFNGPSLLHDSGFIYSKDLKNPSLTLRTHKMGLISISNLTKSDEGPYTCEISRVLDDMGSTGVQRKTFIVTIADLDLMNMPLIYCIASLWIISFTLFMIFICLHFVCSCKHKHSYTRGHQQTRRNHDEEPRNTSTQ